MGKIRWFAPLALAAALGACGSSGGEAGSEAEAAPEAGTAPATSMLSQPACEPSGNMELEGRTSPYDSTTVDVGEGVAKLCYGRPMLRGRTMIGGDAVPYDTLWRTGANEPSTIHLNVPATIAGMEVAAGSYSLYTVPRVGDAWTLIVNRSTSQWGHESQYTPEVRDQEVGRAPVRHEAIDTTVEQLTFRPMEAGGGLVLEWQNSRVHIPIEPRG